METLYHYCSTTSFNSIVQSHSIWLSSLSLANDTMEGKLVYQALHRLAAQDGMDSSSIEQLLANVDGLEKIFDGLGFCLSSNGDLLSQWRGYASDASGLAIGFSKDYLQWLSDKSHKMKEANSFRLCEVNYDFSEHDTLVRPIYERIITSINNGALNIKGPKAIKSYFDPKEIRGAFVESQETIVDEQNQKAYSEFLVSAISLFPVLFTLKTPAFSEESEWRLISTNTKTCQPRPSYRSVHDRLIPFHEFKLLETDQNPIREVVLGPKHNTPIHVVEQFLDDNGFTNVSVYKSSASYR